MASKRESLEYVLEQLSLADGITYRAMMGEFLLYYRGTVFGGIYDDCLLVKDVPSARALLPGAPEEQPYPGAKKMLLVENMENRQLLARLVEAMYPALPQPRKKRMEKTQ